MNESNQQPFYVGQRVVYLGYNLKYERSGPVDILERNHRYRVTKCFYSEIWYVAVDGDTEWAYVHEAFAPYDPPRLEIPAELLEVDTKDGIDVIKEKELV